MSNLSPHLVPDRTTQWSCTLFEEQCCAKSSLSLPFCCAVLTETSESPQRVLGFNVSELPERALAALRLNGFVSPDCVVVSTWQRHLDVRIFAPLFLARAADAAPRRSTAIRCRTCAATTTFKPVRFARQRFRRSPDAAPQSTTI